MNSVLSIAFMPDDDFGGNVGLESTIFPQFSTPGHLPIFEVFGGALNRAGVQQGCLSKLMKI